MANEPTISYTKGEWYLQKYTDAYTNIIRCNNGKHETIFIAATPQSFLPEARANAMLMSAAPDLLEALKQIIEITDRDHIAWSKAKAAIAKATGEYCPNQQQVKEGIQSGSPDLEYFGPNSHCKACEDEKNGIKHIQAARHTCRKRRTNEQ